MVNFKRPFSGTVARRVLWIIGGIIAALVIFEVGLFVGGRHAHVQYFNGFGKGLGSWSMPRPGAPHMRVALVGHGAAGVVSSVTLPAVHLTGRDGSKETVLLASTTRIFLQNARSDATGTAADIRTGDFIVVVGKPDSGSGIDAQFVRIMPAASSSAPAFYKKP